MPVLPIRAGRAESRGALTEQDYLVDALIKLGRAKETVPLMYFLSRAYVETGHNNALPHVSDSDSDAAASYQSFGIRKPVCRRYSSKASPNCAASMDSSFFALIQ
jgi:hypothetical protein